MGATGPVDFDSLFRRVCAEALDRSLWVAVEVPSACGLSVWQRDDSCGLFWMRSEYELRGPLEFVIKAVRPETMFHHQLPEYFPDLAESQIEKVFSPGDIQGWVRFHNPSGSRQAFVQRQAAVFGGAEECQRVIRESGANSFFCLRRARSAVRQDFPEPGKHVAVVAPCDPESGELREEWGIMRATVALFEEAGPSATKVTEVRRVPRGAAWSLASGDVCFAEALFRRLYMNKLPFLVSPAGREFVEGKGDYVVITLRKCTKGPPMLPRVLGSESSSAVDSSGSTLEWVQADKYELPGFLASFLSELGVAADVFDQLDGRRLVHYQAALRRDAWERAWAALELPWRCQKAAYRRQLGGSWAPELSADKPPRFVTRRPAASGSLAPEPLQAEARLALPLRQTFVHFSVRGGSARQRCGSTSVLDCAMHSDRLY